MLRRGYAPTTIHQPDIGSVPIFAPVTCTSHRGLHLFILLVRGGKMRAHLWPCLPLLFFVSSVWSQSSIPPVIPLAIRSPYFNVWANSADAGHTWPFFWTPSVCRPSTLDCPLLIIASQTLGWQGLIRVDNQVYQWLGASGLNPPSANLSSTQLTPTQTIVSMRAGPMDIVATFLSPIEVRL